MPVYRLLAVDIDGTLMNSRGELTAATRDALDAASGAGIHVVLATGRSYRRALPLVEPLSISVPLVTTSGALIKEPLEHRTLFQSRFERELLLDTLEIVAAAGYEAMLQADTFDRGYDFFCVRREVEQPELAEFLALNSGFECVRPDLMTDPPEGCFAAVVMGTHDEMLELERLLHARLPRRLSTHVLRSPRYGGYMCEIALHGVTKWSGVLRLADDWAIEPREIVAVGDDVNDILMIREAGLGIAMGNALPQVKEAADRIAPSHDEDGLVRVVEWLLVA